jgi:hypothetical protein
VLDRPLTGNALEDAGAVLAAFRSGSTFTSVDAIAAPAVFDFHAIRDNAEIRMGQTAAPGRATFVASTPAPAGARTVLLRNGQEIASAEGGALRVDAESAQGSYRVEVRLPGAPGNPPIPWILGNPIYFLNAPPVPEPGPVVQSTLLELPVSWHVEKDRWSSGSVVASVEEVAFYYRLRGPGRGSQFVAAAADLQGRAIAGSAITFTGQAVRPARVSIQLRYRRGGGLRWGRSAYLDATPREVVIPVRELLPADRQTGPAPPLDGAMSLLFVIDLTNAPPGAANTIRLSRVGFAAAP